MHYLSLLLGGGDGDLSGTYLGDPTNLTILDTFSCFLFNVCWTTKGLAPYRKAKKNRSWNRPIWVQLGPLYCLLM